MSKIMIESDSFHPLFGMGGGGLASANSLSDGQTTDRCSVTTLSRSSGLGGVSGRRTRVRRSFGGRRTVVNQGWFGAAAEQTTG